MATLNSAGQRYARSLVSGGSVNRTASWSFSASDGNALLGENGDDWANYGKHHLGLDSRASEDTEQRYKYPFAKDGTLYRSALTAIRQRAGQQSDDDIFNAAGRLLETIDNEENAKMENIERRSLTPFELRQDENAVRVVGHAAVFDQEVEIGGFFREVIKPGAFRAAIGRDDVPFLVNHSDLPLARTRSGTLNLSEDAIGLKVESQLDPEDPDVRRIVPKMKRGDLDKMSFGFRAVDQEWVDNEDDKMPLRIIREAELFDVSIVTAPAYDGTDIALRSLEGEREKVREEAEKEKDEKKRNFENAQLRVKMSKKLKEVDLRERAGE